MNLALRDVRWNYYRALTAAEQAQVLAESVIDRGRRQTLLFRAILLIVPSPSAPRRGAGHSR